MTSNRDGGLQESQAKFGQEIRKQFLFDPKYLNLNHGSFGTYPRSVQKVLRDLQDRAEARPDYFIRYEYPNLLDEARAAISKVLHAPVETLVFVPNATTAVNIVLRNLIYEPGDKIVYFSSIYGACHKAIEYVTETTALDSVGIEFTFPVEDDWLVEELKKTVAREQKAGNKVKIAMFDTVVSMPGVRMPFERLTEACRELGILSLIDAAHAAGHVELDLARLDPDFFVSNCHKWLYTPRGSAIFHVPIRNQALLRSTLPTSHGFIPLPNPNKPPYPSPLPAIGSKSSWVVAFEFVGTIDNSPYLCTPAALQFRESIGGEKTITQYCRDLAKSAANRTAEILGTEVLDNKSQTLTNCCMSNVRLPLDIKAVFAIASKAGLAEGEIGIVIRNWMSKTIVEEYDTFMALMFYGGAFWVRWSGQVYLELADFEYGAEVLKKICQRVAQGEFLPKTSKL